MFRVHIREMYFQTTASYFKAEDKHWEGDEKLEPAYVTALLGAGRCCGHHHHRQRLGDCTV